MKRILYLILIMLIFSCSRDNKKDKIGSISGNVPKYEVAQINDVSYSGVKRLQVKVKVDSILSESEIKSICNDLIPKYKKDKTSAVMFHFYLPGTSIDDFSDAGSAEWGPNGKWDLAGASSNVKYDIYNLSIKVIEPEPKQPADFWYKKTGLEKEKRDELYADILKYKAQGLSTGDACKKVSEKHIIPFSKISDIYAEGATKK